MEFTNNGARYQNIKQAAKSTGLSCYFLRKAVKENKIPYIRMEKSIYIDLERLPEALERLTDER